MSDKYCHDIDKCCIGTNCVENKKNCASECCSGLPEEINPNLAMAKSFPILAERIFDCMVLENPQIGVIDAKFNVTSAPPTGTTYSTTDSICVDEICVNYDAIGAVLADVTDPTNVSLCSKPITLETAPGSVFNTGLSNHYILEISNSACCYRHGFPQDGSKCRLLEQNLTFEIVNLKISVNGKIGCLPFTANYTPATATPALDVALGFPASYNFFGKLCIPNGNKTALLDESFDYCLNVDCVDTANSSFAAGTAPAIGSFTANIESSLIIKKIVSILIQEKLSVLAVPASEAQHCHGSSVVCEPCHNKCRD